MKKVILHLSIIVMLFAGLLVFFFFVYLPNTTNHDQTITVPKLIGMSSDEVENFLKSRSLRYKINDTTFSPDVKAYSVLTQHPLPDSKVKENRMIYITISTKNPPKTDMPQLVDRSLKEAQLFLKQKGLLQGEIIYVNGHQDMVYAQMVGNQKIDSGAAVPKGTKINLKVGNSSDADVAVPDLVDMPIEDAKMMAQGLGLLIEVRPDNNATEGTILKQNPAPGETIKSGQTIDVWIE